MNKPIRKAVRCFIIDNNLEQYFINYIPYKQQTEFLNTYIKDYVKIQEKFKKECVF